MLSLQKKYFFFLKKVIFSFFLSSIFHSKIHKGSGTFLRGRVNSLKRTYVGGGGGGICKTKREEQGGGGGGGDICKTNREEQGGGGGQKLKILSERTF